MQAIHTSKLVRALALGAALGLAFSGSAFAKDKKKKEVAPPKAEPLIDTSKLVWPAPPDLTRIRYVAQLLGQKAENAPVKPKKSGWMDRLAGIETQNAMLPKPVHVLAKPYGVAVDSAGKIYVADSYVAAVFIFDERTGAVEFIRNGIDAKFKDIIGLAIDDSDRLFVSDAGLHQVSVFGKDRKLESVFGSAELGRPSGMAIDNENRFLYVADVEKEQIAVFDADTYKFLRVVGGPGKVEADDSPATFAKPTNVAVDDDGNLYVSDTLNNRVQIFDADGNFISMFGKPGDGPGFLARPKGIALDGDGHIWIVDALQNRVQIFDREGHLLAFFGEPGKHPGQFGLPSGLCIDKQNRVVVAEQLKGRIQVFRYVTEAEAAAQKPPSPKPAANGGGQ
jgi:DNA-binding beta-propeller fold protein YncE